MRFFFTLKFIYFEKATNFLWNLHHRFVDWSYVVTVKSTVEISQIFVAFSKYMNFKTMNVVWTKFFCNMNSIEKIAKSDGNYDWDWNRVICNWASTRTYILTYYKRLKWNNLNRHDFRVTHSSGIYKRPTFRYHVFGKSPDFLPKFGLKKYFRM